MTNITREDVLLPVYQHGSDTNTGGGRTAEDNQSPDDTQGNITAHFFIHHLFRSLHANSSAAGLGLECCPETHKHFTACYVV